VYTLEPKTQNLYSMEFYKKNPALKANEFFKNTLSDYKKADTKILKKNTYKYQGFPAMEVQIEEGQMRLRIRYVVIYNMVYELTVAGSVESVRNENAEKFFNSLKYTPLL
ncbi:MAG: hypothetical protein K2X86_12585, partial [Cytophagaceae bacterium]|nr:hypothetical protein [Cytophagaceae bacterium]